MTDLNGKVVNVNPAWSATLGWSADELVGNNAYYGQQRAASGLSSLSRLTVSTHWDGGLFSNTPLEYVLDYSQRRNRLTFQGPPIQCSRANCRLISMRLARSEKDIRYSSRTNVCSNAFRDRHNVRHAINELYKLLPPNSRARNKPSGSMSMVVYRNGYRQTYLPSGRTPGRVQDL